MLDTLAKVATDADKSLPGVFGEIAPIVDHHGYLAIAIVVLLANIGLPFPAEASVVTGALFARNGHLDFVAVGAVAAIGAVIGGSVGYVVGSRAGHRLLISKGRRIGITEARLERTEQFFQRRGVLVVVAGRFLPILRRLNGVAAGVSEMSWPKFGIGNVIGAVLWAAAWVAIGNQAGAHLTFLARILSLRSVAIVAVVAIVIGLVVYLRRPKTPAVLEAGNATEDPTWTP